MARPKTQQTEEGGKNKDTDQIDELLSSKEYKDKHLGSRSGADVEYPEKITTGSTIFDYVLQGGYRCGWSRFQGDEETGKSSQGLVWGKNWQKKFPDNGMVIYFNAEGRISKDILDRSGIDTDKKRFRIIDSNRGDFIFDLTEKLIMDNPNGLRYFYIYDSMDAMQREQDIGKSYSEPEKIGGQAALNSVGGKRLSLPLSAKGHHLYICSQMREKMAGGSMGAPARDASGGRAIKFYSSLIGEIQKPWTDTLIFEEPSDKKSKIIGRLVTIKLKKTPNETTGEIVQFPVKKAMVGGVWPAYEAYMVALAWGWLTKSGAWFEFANSFKEELTQEKIEFQAKMQGEKQVIGSFDSNLDLVNFILNKLKALITQ